MGGCVVMVWPADRADVDDLNGQGHGRWPGCLMRAPTEAAVCWPSALIALGGSVSARGCLPFGGQGREADAGRRREGHGIGENAGRR